MIDLMDLAPQASWASGKLLGKHNVVSGTFARLPFNGSDADSRGFVRIDTVRMEDGQTHRALRTHPQWVDDGFIKGWLPWRTMPTGARFTAKVGYLDGATVTDGVRFQVWEHHMHDGREVWSRIADLPKFRSGQLAEIEADLSHLQGLSVGIELRVDAGDGIGFRSNSATAAQDWVAWVDPQITQGTGRQGDVIEIAFTQVRVNQSQEGSTHPTDGPGVEPMIGAIYFRTVLGVQGGTNVVVLDSLDRLGEEMMSGSAREISPDRRLAVRDAIKPAAGSNFFAGGKGIVVFGMGYVALEEDAGFQHHIRPQLRSAACALRQALQQIETLSPEDAIRQLETLPAKFMADELPACRLPHSTAPDPGHSNPFTWWWGFGEDDKIGRSAVIFSGVTRETLAEIRETAERLPDNDPDRKRLMDAADAIEKNTVLMRTPLATVDRIRQAQGGNDWSLTVRLSNVADTERLTAGF